MSEAEQPAFIASVAIDDKVSPVVQPMPNSKPDRWQPAMVWTGDPMLVFASEHLGLVATALGFLLVAVEVLLAARLDHTVALAIVSTASPTVVLPGMLVAIMPSASVLAFYGAWYFTYSAYRKHRPVAFSTYVALAATGAFLLFVPMVPALLYLFVIPFPVLRQCWKAWRKRRALKKGKPEGKAATDEGKKGYSDGFERLVSIFFVTLVALLMSGPMWLPSEDVRLNSGSQVTGYVLDSWSDWTSVLQDSTRTVLRIRTTDIESRTLCSIGTPRQGGLLDIGLTVQALPKCP